MQAGNKPIINEEKININNDEQKEKKKMKSVTDSNKKPASSSNIEEDLKGENMEKSLRYYAKVFFGAEALTENEKDYDKKAFAAYEITSKIQILYFDLF